MALDGLDVSSLLEASLQQVMKEHPLVGKLVEWLLQRQLYGIRSMRDVDDLWVRPTKASLRVVRVCCLCGFFGDAWKLAALEHSKAELCRLLAQLELQRDKRRRGSSLKAKK
eukprot:TRINITY_DN34413_c0_g1_i1.p2 TRINITY_DN34413_c0_g1~~TRINITY_DN34413_c0_g1_i1.p2  ORF type:complete len:112 (+),score=51.76 TRINITY_DN34413_c0_g1_i1:75-410(+)